MENCTKFGHFILRKIIENCCHQMSYFEAKMHQIVFRLGSTPHPTGGAYSAPPDPLAGIEGPTSKGGGEWVEFNAPPDTI